MKVLVEFEYDENALGCQWFNKENLEALIYTKTSTKPELLKINSFFEGKPITDCNTGNKKKSRIHGTVR